ncbi:dienelactone hydrolase family protein [Gordonia sp. i37]|uniref:dienelactone hydrolase family protein n=1 Tax=Gordonia sp. i37 TaxID=1961707 RepID=UPI0009AF08EF|nr:dienelactone hydrolase family protein [Gordonia sp. i37]OPX10895.1 dienelactone hydrolase [Gordonia sp. i37]
MTETTGEMITITAADGPAEAYMARPVSADADATWPGVLFLIDAIGLRPQIETMVDRIASWGYVVLAPNLFYRSGSAAETSPDGPLLDDDSRAAFFAGVRPRMQALTTDLARRDLATYLDALHALPGVRPGSVGTTGYCMGGRLALLTAATRPDDVAAVGMFHTGGVVTDAADSPHLSLSDVRAEVLAVHADHDQSMPPEAIAQFEHALTSSGVIHHATVYPGAAHGYTMADTAPYNHDAAEYHYAELQKLFDRTLH